MKKNIVYILLSFLIAFIFMGCSQPEPKPPHVHTFSNDWTLDDTAHWHAATCGHSEEVKGEELHKFPENWTIITSATEDSDGLEEGFCDVCNYHTTRVILQLNHNHDIAKAWTADSTKHWHTASCGKVEHNEDMASHIWNHKDYQYDSETGKDIRICTVCSYVDAKTHNHTEDRGTVTTQPTCETNGVKTYKCIVCKAILRTEDIPYPKLCSTPVTEVVDGITYVYFGDWPQSVLPATSTVTVDETVSVEMGANTYYLGSDGNYYAKCAENAYKVDDQYKYHDGTQVGSYGRTTRYFKVEPIKWRVLTDNYSGKKLLLAENILTANVPYYEYTDTRTIEGETVYANNYKHSQIRAYLNGLTYQGPSSEITKYNGNGFLQTAFTQNAQGLIAETGVDNSPETTGKIESTYATKYACENTTDKIFLLSVSEVNNSDYFFVKYYRDEGNPRIRYATDYAKANYLALYSTDNDGDWWLRSPYYDISCYAHHASKSGSFENHAGFAYCGVAPALSISF